MRYRCSIAFSSCELVIGSLSSLLLIAKANGQRLLFMTYNGWVMLAVAVGAFVGYLAFGNSSPTKSVACH